MNQSKRKLLMYAGGAATALTLSGGLMAAGAFAATDTATTTTSPVSGLITKLATKFGLNESDVKAVFDQDRTEREAEMQAKAEDRLTQAVTDGDLTQAQKDLIVAKQAELKAARDAAMSAGTKPTADEMKAQRDALEKWASDNGIDMKWLRGGFGGGRGGHGGHGFGGERPGDAPSSGSTGSTTAS